MKKMVFVLIALVAFNTQAQKKGKMSPEEMATKRTEQMTSDLDLTEVQQKEVHALNLKNAETVGKLRGKSRSDFSEEERTAMRSRMKELQVENQKVMKGILTEEQYVTWDKMQKERMEEARSRRGSQQKNKKQ